MTNIGCFVFKCVSLEVFDQEHRSIMQKNFKENVCLMYRYSKMALLHSSLPPPSLMHRYCVLYFRTSPKSFIRFLFVYS